MALCSRPNHLSATAWTRSLRRRRATSIKSRPEHFCSSPLSFLKVLQLQSFARSLSPLQRQSESQLLCFHARAHSFVKTPGVGGMPWPINETKALTCGRARSLFERDESRPTARRPRTRRRRRKSAPCNPSGRCPDTISLLTRLVFSTGISERPRVQFNAGQHRHDRGQHHDDGQRREIALRLPITLGEERDGQQRRGETAPPAA